MTVVNGKDSCWQLELGTPLEEWRTYYPQMAPRFRLLPELSDKGKKAKWVAWLRDPANQDKQGQHRLSQDGRFCCLGAYCEYIAEPDFISKRVIEAIADKKVVKYTYKGKFDQGNTNLLPRNLAKDMGIDENGAFYYSFKVDGDTFWTNNSLSNLNDDGFTFTQIGDVIDYFL